MKANSKIHNQINTKHSKRKKKKDTQNTMPPTNIRAAYPALLVFAGTDLRTARIFDPTTKGVMSPPTYIRHYYIRRSGMT